MQNRGNAEWRFHRAVLFTYDNRSYTLFEKTFVAGYQFMKVYHNGDERAYKIGWKDVVLLLGNPIVNTLKPNNYVACLSVFLMITVKV